TGRTGRTETGLVEEPVGEADLTPVMHWTAGPDLSYDGLAQAVLLVTPPDLTYAAAVHVLQAVLDRHDMLRARLTDKLVVPAEGAVRASELLSQVRDAVLDDQLAAAVARLDPAAGRMLQAVWFTDTGRLLLVAHHLVVDGVSWRIIMSDLAEAWQSGRALPRGGTSFRTWSRLLGEEAHRPGRVRELDWWTEALGSASPLIERTLDADAPLREQKLVLPPGITGPLLTEVPAAYHAAVPDVLLTALALAAAAWRERRGDLTGRSLLVGLEGHGREEDIAEGVDLSGTVGWFTTFHPVAVDPGPLDVGEALSGGPAAGIALKRIKEQLRAVPEHGLGYGLLRHLNPDTAPALEKLPQPQVLFNYLGRFTASGATDQPWELAPEAPMLRVPAPTAFVGLEINAVAVEEAGGVRLRVSASWPDGFLTEPEAADLLVLWERALHGLARHAEAAPTGGLTPSDLPLVELTQEDIDDFENDFDDSENDHDDF
ncbi:MAG: non-ribosomal peptide synthetase, partial [Streptomyces sp.]|nr:non-ribosomal peptide synthetase [Streptomyces sp.]